MEKSLLEDQWLQMGTTICPRKQLKAFMKKMEPDGSERVNDTKIKHSFPLLFLSIMFNPQLYAFHLVDGLGSDVSLGYPVHLAIML